MVVIDEKNDKVNITIDEEKYCEWLQGALKYQADGWDRTYWVNYETGREWTTTETKSTTFENGDAVICITEIKGDNNVSYDNICDCCTSHDDDYENECDCWESWKDFYDEFEDMQFGCMENMGWIDNIKEGAIQSINQSRTVHNQKPVEIIWE